MSTRAEPTVDGRRARRVRNRAAVVDAMLSLLLEQGRMPATEEVSDRAGVSVSSVFRYFEGIEDLQQAAVTTYFDRFGHLFEIDDVGAGDLDDRIRRLASARVTLHRTVAPVARLVRVTTLPGSVVEHRLAATRRHLADQVHEHFAPELDARSRASAADVAATIDTLTSFEAWDLLHGVHRRSDTQIRRAWTASLTALLVCDRPDRG